MQQDWPLEGFGEDPAAASPHFTQTVQRPPIESCGDSEEVLPPIRRGNPKRHQIKVKLDDTQQPKGSISRISCRDSVFQTPFDMRSKKSCDRKRRQRPFSRWPGSTQRRVHSQI